MRFLLVCTKSMATLYFNPPASWPVAILQFTLLVEAIVILATLPSLIRFYRDLLHGRLPSLSLPLCRRIMTALGVMLVVAAMLSVVAYFEYINDKSILSDSPLRPEIRAAFFTMSFYEYCLAVVWPMTLSALGLVAWVYPLIYCQARSRGKFA